MEFTDLIPVENHVKIIRKERYCIPVGAKPTAIDGIKGESSLGAPEDSISPLEGWSLTQEGKLVRGLSGWLIDEHGFYILKDGRRLKAAEKALRIGADDIWSGLSNILGHTLSSKQDEYDTAELFRDYSQTMHEAVYQAFQINICCARGGGTAIEGKASAVFYSIGKDETGIPIVVTRIKGKENSLTLNTIDRFQPTGQGESRTIHKSGLKKLVIASPHGDERNAQRVILQTQRYFTVNGGVPENTEFYFIPCISPTLAFADARGVPKNLLSGMTILTLHDTMTFDMRSKIQTQKDAANPQYGVDANRDYYFSLPSSKVFANFIKDITGVDVQAKTGRDNGNCTVFFMHGYDSSKANYDAKRGCVYGQYEVDGTDGYIPLNIKRYTDFMTQSLFGYINSNANEEQNYNVAYFYRGETEELQYRGEWIRHLYGETGKLNILAFDIELGQTYNEGVRGADYAYDKVGEKSMPFFNKQIKNNGFFVPDELREKREDDLDSKPPIYHTTSFYDFLKNFYNKKAEIDAKKDW